MPIGTPVLIDTEVGTTNTTYTFTVPAGGVPAGAMIFCLLIASTEGRNWVSGADSAGNTYVLEDQNNNHPLDNLCYYFVKSPNVSALSSGDTITQTLSNTVGNRAAIAFYVEGLVEDGIADDKSAINSTSGSSSNTANITPTEDDVIFIGTVGFTAGTQRTITNDPDFVELTSQVESSRRTAYVGYRIVSASETRDYNVTYNATAQTHIQISAYAEEPTGPPPSGPFPRAVFGKRQKQARLLRM